MKYFVVFACALAAASAGNVSPLVYGAQHVPVIANGVPVEPLEVQQARAAHLVAKAEAYSRNGAYVHGVVPAYATPFAYAGYYGVPAVTPNGVPLDTAEVAVAKAKHFAAHAEALARNGPVVTSPVLSYAAPVAYGQHFPVIANGVPVDTLEVQHAKAAHFAAYAKAAADAAY